IAPCKYGLVADQRMLPQESEPRIEVSKYLIVGLGARPFEDIVRNARMIQEVHRKRDKILVCKPFDDVPGKFIQGSDRRNHNDSGKRPLPWRKGQESADGARPARNP